MKAYRAMQRLDTQRWLRVKGFVVNNTPSGFIAAHRTGVTILVNNKRTRVIAGDSESGYFDSTENQFPSADLIARMLLQLPPDMRI